VDVASEELAGIFEVPVGDPIMTRTTIRHDGDDVVEYGQAFTPRNVVVENEYRRRAQV
jgi:hypothetical protein